jgi:hypothetical protein
VRISERRRRPLSAPVRRGHASHPPRAPVTGRARSVVVVRAGPRGWGAGSRRIPRGWGADSRRIPRGRERRRRSRRRGTSHNASAGRQKVPFVDVVDARNRPHINAYCGRSAAASVLRPEGQHGRSAVSVIRGTGGLAPGVSGETDRGSGPACRRPSLRSRMRFATSMGGGYAAATGAPVEGEAVARMCCVPPVCLARYSAASAARRQVSSGVPGSAAATPMLTLGCK